MLAVQILNGLESLQPVLLGSQKRNKVHLRKAICMKDLSLTDYIKPALRCLLSLSLPGTRIMTCYHRKMLT